jgi:hypothetical protein
MVGSGVELVRGYAVGRSCSALSGGTVGKRSRPELGRLISGKGMHDILHEAEFFSLA